MVRSHKSCNDTLRRPNDPVGGAIAREHIYHPDCTLQRRIIGRSAIHLNFPLEEKHRHLANEVFVHLRASNMYTCVLAPVSLPTYPTKPSQSRPLHRTPTYRTTKNTFAPDNQQPQNPRPQPQLLQLPKTQSNFHRQKKTPRHPSASIPTVESSPLQRLPPQASGIRHTITISQPSTQAPTHPNAITASIPPNTWMRRGVDSGYAQRVQRTGIFGYMWGVFERREEMGKRVCRGIEGAGE